MTSPARTIWWDAFIREALVRRCGHRETFYLRAPSTGAFRAEVAQVPCATCRGDGRTPYALVAAYGRYPKTRKERSHADADS